jgi:glycosyltransferase involved in cell wall biosynthesis
MVAMKVSVVIPTKDRPNELKECIEALLKQTYPIYELIIVDGSSSEKVSEEIKRICLSRTGDYYDLARAIMCLGRR